MKRRLKLVRISFLLSLLLTLQSISLDGLGDLFTVIKAKAVGETTQDFAISYANDSGDQQQSQTGVYFNKQGTFAGNVDIIAPPSKLIESITENIIGGGTQDITPPGAVNQTSYKGTTLELEGTKDTVNSIGNDTAQGYFAWYRYIPGASTGVNWYADLPDNEGITHNVNCGPDPGTSDSAHTGASPPTEYNNGYEMPRYPGCLSSNFLFRTLSLTATKSKNYNSSDNLYVPDGAVASVESKGTPQVNVGVDPIAGPDGVPPGQPDSSQITLANPSIYAIDSSNYRVLFNQNFNSPSAYYRELHDPPNGAKVMVYYSAFLVDLQGTTYKYPTTVTVTFKDAPSGINLTGTITATDACIQAGTTETFTYTVTNNGTQNDTSPVTGKILVDGNPLTTISFPSLAAGTSKSGTFTYTFGSATSKTFTLGIDPASGEPNTADNNPYFAFSAASSCSEGDGGGGDPGPAKVTGTLSVKYPSVKFGTEQEIIQMSDVGVSGGGCSLRTGTMVFTQGSIKWTHTLNQTGSFDDAFTATTGNGIGPGSVDVEYDITTTCGLSAVIGPGHFTVTTDLGLQPPQFQVGWFDEDYYYGYNTPITTVPIGETISFGLIRKPKTPNDNGLPYDPNGGSIMYTSDIKTSSDPWIHNLYSGRGYGIHDDHFDNIKADEKGSHTIHMTAIDDMGAMANPQSATIDIVDPNPVPVITMPTGRIVEGRTFPAPTCERSYSPYKNRTIASCIWYGTNLNYYANPGSYPVKLDVTDNTGLMSLSPATAALVVQPDLPPIAQLWNPGTGLRGIQMVFQDRSYSPDGDPIAEHTDQLSCDANNNGSYADEASATLVPDSNGYFFFTPSRIGTCQIRIHLREGVGYRKSDDKGFTFEVINDNPSASFSVKGGYQPPPLSIPTPISADQFITDGWKLTSLDGEVGQGSPSRWYKGSSGNLKPIPMYGVPPLPDHKFPYNGIDIAGSLTVRQATPAEISAYNGNSYSAPTIPFYSYSAGKVKKTVDGAEEWAVDDNATSGIFAVSDDQTKVAYVCVTYTYEWYSEDDYYIWDHYYLRVRDATTGGLLGDTYLSSAKGFNFPPKVLGQYEKGILVSSNTNGLTMFDYSGTEIWNNPSGWRGYGNISKDGFMYFSKTDEFSDCCSTNFRYYLGQVNLHNGAQNLIYLGAGGGDNEDDAPTGGMSSPTLLDDQKVLVMYYEERNGSYDYRYKVFEGPPTAYAKKEPYFTFGQFYKPDATVQNGELTYSFKLTSDTILRESTGFSFRMADNRNFYRVEHTSNQTSLVAYVDGNRSVIDSVDFQLAAGVFNNVKIKFSDTHLKVYVNGSLIIDVFDSTLSASGMYGPYSTKPDIELKNVTVLPYPPAAFLNNVFVVGNPIRYDTNYTDPESDPLRLDSAKWTFFNLQPYMYLNQGDGFSDASPYNSYNNQVVAAPNASINKVGYFKIDYQVADDPSPVPYTYADGTYSSYSKYSDPYTQYAKVVRAPVAKFTSYVNADNTFGYTDEAYDPDRCYSNLSCQSGYEGSHGIFDHRWKYTSPDGTTNYGFPSRPGQSGTYMISEAVMQEDGVWSDWYDRSLNATIPVANNPPSATLTFPSGSQTSPSYVNSLTPAIKWNQADPDPDTTFAAYEVIVKDANGNVVIDSGIQAQGTASAIAQWTLDQPLVMGEKYEIQVRVNDGLLWSAWSNAGWLITNRPPNASMTYPNGTSAAPTIVSTLRPTFVWNQTDPDSGTTLSYFQLQVWDETNAALLLDSGQRWQGSTAASGSWTADADLPVRQKLRVRVRVYDGFAWSDWSSDAWLLMNRTPLADFDWSPKPVWEGDSLRLANVSSDPDGDPLAYVWKVTGPNGAVASYSTKDVTLSSPVIAGTYTVTLTVSDGIASASVTRAIPAQPLTIAAEVTYTPQWLTYHEQHGHRTTSDPKDFYSGEIFVVRAVSSPTAVTDVSAWIDTTAADGSLLACSTLLTLSGTPYHFAGELYADAFSSLTAGLPPGPLPIHFRIRYANGVVKVQDVPVNILGPVLRTVGVHRVQ